MARIHQARAAAMRAHSRQYHLQKDATAFNFAERALEKGAIPIAVRIYKRLSLSRNEVPHTLASRQRVASIRARGEAELDDLKERLPSIVDDLISSSGSPNPSVESRLRAWQESFRNLISMYDEVPQLSDRIQKFANAQRRLNGATINEPEARRLLAEGMELEQKEQPCCAYNVYITATSLAPAKSAALAKERLQELQREPSIAGAAKRCKALQWCHNSFGDALDLASTDPDEAREMLSQILERAPADSTVHREAKKQIASLAQPETRP